jgi:hypothetical protein
MQREPHPRGPHCDPLHDPDVAKLLIRLHDRGWPREELEMIEAVLTKLMDKDGRAAMLSTERSWESDAALRPQPKREGRDYWPTPHCLARALVEHVLPSLPVGLVWEPAAGDGRLAHAMLEAGREVVYCDIISGVDFLHDDPIHPGKFAAIITNGPFNDLDAFTARGLSLLDAGITKAFVLLFRHDHLQAATRVTALNRASLILGCNWRPTWIEGSEGNPRWSFSWVVWRDDHQGPPTSIHTTAEN